MRALLVYPTHENVGEVLLPFYRSTIDAKAFPKRVTANSKQGLQNCWNDQADIAELIGLAVVRAICPQCQFRKQCQEVGYLGQLVEVQNAEVALCTHKRAEYTSFAELSEGCFFISVHENPVNILRPKSEASETDLLLSRFAEITRHLCVGVC